MAKFNEASDRIELSKLDIRLLSALRDRPMNGYRMARVAENDWPEGPAISNGALQPALKGLLALALVKKSGAEYERTPLGGAVLKHELAGWKRLARLTS